MTMRKAGLAFIVVIILIYVFLSVVRVYMEQNKRYTGEPYLAYQVESTTSTSVINIER